MTFKLVDDPDAVSVLAGQVSDLTGQPLTHIEKDFWVTEVLRGVVAAATEIGVEVLFKGGTSLSKVYGMIERFSEDVDVLVVLPEDTMGAHDRMLKGLVEGAANATGLEAQVDGATATKGVKRTARFMYRAAEVDDGGLSEGVCLELGTRGGGVGAAQATVQSLLAQHALEQMTDAAEVVPVRVRVMAPWRTLVEKLVLLHTVHSLDDAPAAMRGARHFYDVHQLLKRPEVVAGVNEVGVAALARDVCMYSREAGLPADERPRDGFAESPAFTGGGHTDAVREAYETQVLGQLLWPSAERPSFDDCIATVQGRRAEL